MCKHERSHVDAALTGLKDFQKRTVAYVFERLYAGNASTRFLVADEVGLGKTLVARGIIAKTIEHLQAKEPGRRIDILYVCSNAAIATQNVDRLKIGDAGEFAIATRLTYLPTQVRSLRKNAINFLSLTPGTALDHARSRGGQADERVILYRMLHDMPWGHGKRRKTLRHGLFNLMQATAGRDSWRQKVRRTLDEEIDRELAVMFRRAVAGKPELYNRVKDLCYQFHRYRDRYLIPWSERDLQLSMIGQLRAVLAEVCLTALQPALVILDEFQRFKYLLDRDDEAALLAGALFAHPEVRVLLLSATPYKMFTLDAEIEEEDHYPDFLRTLKFLYNDDNALAATEQLIANRRRTMQATSPDNEMIRAQSNTLRRELLKVMCRTERVGTTRDHNAMLKEVEQTALPEPADLLHAAFVDSAARSVGAGDITEYWKSAPYLLNFLRHYDLRKRIDSVGKDPPSVLLRCLQAADGQVLRQQTIEQYARLDPGNARMRSLIRDTIDSGQWRLLWMPPSLPYSLPAGAYEYLQDTTKALVFSAWAAVPDAIAAVCSFEAERRMVGDAAVEHSNLYDRVKPLLRFARASTDNRLTGMPVLAWLMPSPQLAKAVDPLRLALTHGAGRPLPLDVLLAEATSICDNLLRELPKGADGTRPDERWYWAAMGMLAANSGVTDWLQSTSGWAAATPDYEPGTRFRDHVDLLASAVKGELQLGPQPEDLARVLAELALAAPGTCAIRALSGVAPGLRLDDPLMLSAAARIASGFRSLFNMPETITLLRGSGEDSYWRLALRYALDGNIQALLDEHTHVLVESLGLIGHTEPETVEKVSLHIQDTLSLRTAQVRLDELKLSGTEIAVSTFNTRCRFALRFADLRDDNDQAVQRAEAVRDAFNSPFRPFVLASTSIGQEGLDFHTWCHAVVHWNLPSNPVDLEQREGRVHRYKGHAVRKNISEKYGLAALNRWDGRGNPWQYLFALAESERSPGLSDLIPYWIFEDGHARVERRVPMLPFSREVGKLARLRRGLALYRIVFGQPRQEDLLAYLDRRANLDTKAAMDWLISLEPPSVPESGSQCGSGTPEG